MRKHFTKSLICLLLTFVMLLGMLPTVSASEADRTDLTVDFNPKYKTPDAALSAVKNFTNETINVGDEGQIQWKHATHFDDDGGDLREYLFSTDPEDKYIVLDNDISATWGYGGEGKSVGCVKITADKVLDLNGHKWKFRDIRNKHDGAEDYQAENSKYFNTYLIEISNGATLTIIDSSETPTKKGTGEIYHDAYMIDPYKHHLKYWTTRDLFNVSNGNLIIYGGTFRAGRAMSQSNDDVWTELQTVIGEAVEFGTAVVEYSTGVSAAKAALDDTSFNLKDELKRVQDQSEETEEPTGGSTSKPSGADPEAADKKQSTPEGAATGTNGRNPTVEEKQAAKNKEQEQQGQQEQQNNASRDGTQKTTVNSELAKAKNAVVTAATDKTKVKGMVDSGFKLAGAIKDLFTTNEGSIVTQSFLGTAVHVGNNGTFVSYGGTYKGYGMTPNTRNAVVECTKKGKCYIYGGDFEGYCGANVFNIVEANNTPQTKYQYVGSADNLQQVKIGPDETNGLVTIEMETDSKGNPIKDENGNYKMVDTSSIQVRGGTFKCYYEQAMVALSKDKVEGSGDHNADEDWIMVFPGTPGGVNLGVESFNKDFIRDGRIQIVDTYGDGALVLADDKKGPQDKVYHHRLFCDDFELRIKKYLDVYPNKSQTNSTYSFALKTRWGGSDALPYNQKAEGFTNDAENERGPLSSDELFFTYPINSKNSEKYYVIPYLTDTDPWGENLGSSDVWYYNTPADKDDKPIGDSFLFGYDSLAIRKKDGSASRTFYQNTDTKGHWSDAEEYIGKSDYTSGKQTHSYEFQQKVKWFTYEVYRVDPLTRENIGDPVLKTTYGVSDESIRCRLPLSKLGINYQSGEMYRVVLNVSEYFNYAKDEKSLPTANCRSSIVFMCYDDNTEMKVEGTQSLPDYTPLQWLAKPKPGMKASIQLKNGWAGVVDYETRKIFDVYYQWYAIDENGKETLIGGTDNVYTGEVGGLANHFFNNFLPGRDGYKYVNTEPPVPANTKSWTPELLHTYTDNDTPNAVLCAFPDKTLSRDNNIKTATNSDTLYIPDDLEGKTIYCKAICVNSFWQKNYDHIQTFYSHKVVVGDDRDPNAPRTASTAEITASEPLYDTAGKAKSIKDLIAYEKKLSISGEHVSLDMFNRFKINDSLAINSAYKWDSRTKVSMFGYIKAEAGYVLPKDFSVTFNGEDVPLYYLASDGEYAEVWLGVPVTCTHYFVNTNAWYSDDTDHWRECVICGDKVEIEPHKWETEESGGSTIYTCSDCGYTYKETGGKISPERLTFMCMLIEGEQLPQTLELNEEYRKYGTISGVKWQVENDDTGALEPVTDRTIVAGKQYHLQIDLTMNDGYYLDEDLFRIYTLHYIYASGLYSTGTIDFNSSPIRVEFEGKALSQGTAEFSLPEITAGKSLREALDEVVVNTEGMDIRDRVFIRIGEKSEDLDDNDMIDNQKYIDRQYSRIEPDGATYYSPTPDFKDAVAEEGKEYVIEAAIIGDDFYMTNDDMTVLDQGNAYRVIKRGMTGEEVSWSADILGIYSIHPDGYELNFDTSGGSAVSREYVDYGDAVDFSWFVPTKDGYSFEGWYQEPECINPVERRMILTADTTVYAKWTEIKTDDCGGDKSICPSAPYTDVAEYGNWAHAGIDYCIRNGLMNGINANTFDPKGSMTRAMVVTVLWRQAGSPAPSKPAAFDDLTQSWYMDAVAWAAENGVVNGVGGTRFAPGDPVTREQMAAILQRYTANVLGKDVSNSTDISGYPDYADVSSFAVTPMAWANAEGLITGVSSNGRTTLNPKSGATREQVATILMRFVQNIA